MNEPAPEIAPRDLHARLGRGEGVALLDVREPVERAFCAIAPASNADVVDLHVPMNEVPARIEAIRAARDGRTLVVYCHQGVRSRSVVDWLSRQGLADLANLAGGIDAWSEDVDRDVPRY